MRRLTLAALPLILAACGGGGSGSEGLVPDDDPNALPDLPMGFRLVETYRFPSDPDCQTSMAQITLRLGYLPEDVYPLNGSYYDESTGEHEVIWYYWDQGEGVDWVWDENGCRATVFAFDPIT